MVRRSALLLLSLAAVLAGMAALFLSAGSGPPIEAQSGPSRTATIWSSTLRAADLGGGGFGCQPGQGQDCSTRLSQQVILYGGTKATLITVSLDSSGNILFSVPTTVDPQTQLPRRLPAYLKSATLHVDSEEFPLASASFTDYVFTVSGAGQTWTAGQKVQLSLSMNLPITGGFESTRYEVYEGIGRTDMVVRFHPPLANSAHFGVSVVSPHVGVVVGTDPISTAATQGSCASGGDY